MTRKTRTTAATQPQPLADHQGGRDDTRPSKSQLKREMTALQALGAEIVELPKDAFKRMPLPEDLADAVREARRITDHEGKRRQLQYVGRLMRGLPDTDVAALRTALDTYNGTNKAETARLHWVERTRAQLLASDEALTEFLRAHPGADVQQGRTLIRNARRETVQGKPPRYFRELFQWIKEVAGDSDPRAEHAGVPASFDNEQDDDNTA
ncbi:ribosome-associated protein [Mycetohabitans endofungorum]|uniref:ribosome biogenesis factor YjgA n=1 Tax=Mycetohabitans endofungorum TaxID=417203 RepID=UPI002B060B30|nr:ribosome biogenesis factor YjgA [Mycetohabitans endofungorum]